MQNTSVMGLHLHYRLWIAEMNADITVLRILGDYMEELTRKKNEPAVKAGIDAFQQQFTSLRKEIDELKHEIQLAKMTVAASLREAEKANKKPSLSGNHPTLKKRYVEYRKIFDKVKKEFSLFQSKWL